MARSFTRTRAPTSMRPRSPAICRSDDAQPFQPGAGEQKMPETLVKVDLKQSPYENDMIHNRWHPDIPMVATVNPGDEFVIETYDWTGGFIKNNESAND